MENAVIGFAMKKFTAIVSTAILAITNITRAESLSGTLSHGADRDGDILSVDIPADAEWDMDPVAWRRDGDAFVGDNSGRALAPSPKGRRVEIRARVTPQGSRIPEYASIGLAIFDDIDRYWNFALLKGPASKGSWHRYELKAQGDGQWGIEERLMTRVTNKRDGEWEWAAARPLALLLAGARRRRRDRRRVRRGTLPLRLGRKGRRARSRAGRSPVHLHRR